MRDELELGLDFEPLTIGQFMGMDDESVTLNKDEWIKRYDNYTNIFGVTI